MLKRLTVLFIMTLICLAFVGSAEATPTVILDGRQLSFDVQPIIENDRTLVPLRAIFEAMGATVTWNEETQSATATKDDTTVMIKIGSTTSIINGQIKYIDVPAKIVNGRTLAPLRFVGEAFGGTVQWTPVTELITITLAPSAFGQLGTSIANPVPMGQSYVTTGGFQVTVNKLTQGTSAWSVLSDPSMPLAFLNNPPAPDMKYVIVTYTIKDVSSLEEPAVLTGFDFSLTGSSNLIFRESVDIALPSTGPLSRAFAYMFPGDQDTGSAVFYVPNNESGMRLIFKEYISFKNIYFEIH